jgi:filamentous hemagglutinin family protein
MKNKFSHTLLTLTSLIVGTQSANAQQVPIAPSYTPSGRIPVADSTQIGTQVSGSGNNFNITGGLNKGQTLFHSFSDFSVPIGGAANFINSPATREIVTRVTGTNFSDINGLINSNGANFFLINPNGIVFGTGAQLNVGKAFMASTANSIDLVAAGGQSIKFGTNPNGDALLSVAPNVLFNVSGLNLDANVPGNSAIINYGSLQTNNPNQYIGLIGGSVGFIGGQILAPGAKVDLGGLSQAGSIGFSADNGIQLPANVERGNVVLVQVGMSPSIIGVRAGGGGSVGVFAKDISLQGAGTQIISGIATGLGSPTAIAGDIKLDATGNITLSESKIFNQVAAGGTGKGGNIEITTGNLALTNGAALITSTFGQGDAGNIKITTIGGDILFDGGQDSFRSGVLSTVEQGAVGKGGGIEITTRNLTVTTGAQLNANTRGQGDAGSVKITTIGGDILFDGFKDGFPSGAFSTVEQGAVGKGGEIEINTRNLTVANAAQLQSSTRGQGDAGSVKITTIGGDILFDGFKDGFISSAFSTVEQGAVGKGGNIEITTRNLTVTNAAKLQASTFGEGDAGRISVESKGKLSVTNDGNIFSGIYPTASGDSQGIKIYAGELELINGSSIQADTLQSLRANGTGNAGSIEIVTSGNLTIVGNVDPAVLQKISGISSSSLRKGNPGKITINTQGNKLFLSNNAAIFSALALTAGGNSQGINIDTGDLILTNQASIGTFTAFTKGNSGDITIISKGNVSLTDSPGISSANFGEGQAGNILISTNQLNLNKSTIFTNGFSGSGGNLQLDLRERLLLINNSRITTDSGSGEKNGNGGNITINSPLIIATPGNNDITANAYAGNGGKVDINSQGLFGIQFRAKGQDSLFTNDITASSTFGPDGNVNIDTPGTDPGKDSTQLPNVPTDASNQISQVCSASNRQNKLTVTGRGGLPPNANDPLTSDVVWQDARAASSQPAASSATTNPVKLAPPAVGWVFDGKGKVTLIAAGSQPQAGTSVACPQGVGK